MAETRTAAQLVQDSITAFDIEYVFGNPGTTETTPWNSCRARPTMRGFGAVTEGLTELADVADVLERSLARHGPTLVFIACQAVRCATPS